VGVRPSLDFYFGLILYVFRRPFFFVVVVVVVYMVSFKTSYERMLFRVYI